MKTVSQFDHPASNESKNGPMANFPMYFLGHSFVNAKMDGPATYKLQKSSNFFWWLMTYRHSPGQIAKIKFNFFKISDRLILRSIFQNNRIQEHFGLHPLTFSIFKDNCQTFRHYCYRKKWQINDSIDIS